MKNRDDKLKGIGEWTLWNLAGIKESCVRYTRHETKREARQKAKK